MALTRTVAPQADTDVTVVSSSTVERDYTELTIRDLLSQAVEVSEVRNNASSRIKQIKDVIIARLRIVYDREHPTHVDEFENLSGMAFRDPDDEDQVIVQHPDVPVAFKFKRVESIKWHALQQVIAAELARCRAELLELDTNSIEARELQGRITALEWMLGKRTEYTYEKSFGRFVAVGEVEAKQEG